MSTKNFYFCVVVIACFSLISTCFATVSDDLPYAPGQILVKFAPKAGGFQRSTDERNQILSSFKAGTVKHSTNLVSGLSLIELPKDVNVTEALSMLKDDPNFIYAEPNWKVRVVSREPNDPNFTNNNLWGLHNIGQYVSPYYGTPDTDIDAPEAWDIKTDASSVIVAIIDTGIDYTNSDLSSNMWINPGEDHPPLGVVGTEDFDGVNDDGNVDGSGNPLVDDIYGYDFCTYGGKQRDSDPMDDDFHGTHLAGAIGGRGNNGIGVTGICWKVKIMALKFMNNSGYGWSYDAIACIDYAVKKGAKVINASWRYYEGNPRLTDVNALRDAITNAGTAGILFVAAAGNEENDNDTTSVYPASYNSANIVSVMATDQKDWIGSWGPGQSSNYGLTTVDLAAPGTNIMSTMPTYLTESMRTYGLSTNYEFLDGTSQACAYISGACALVWAANPTLTHLQVKQRILNGVIGQLWVGLVKVRMN